MICVDVMGKIECFDVCLFNLDLVVKNFLGGN